MIAVQVTRKLSSLFISKNPEAADAFAVLQEIASHKILVGLILNIISDPAYLRIACNGSYRHPNGFTKLVLLRDDTIDFQLRLHHWNRPARDGHAFVDEPHNHIRDFWSIPIFGTLLARDYEIVPGKSDYSMLDTTDRGLNSGYTYRFLGNSGLAVISEYIIDADKKCRHWLPFDRIHSIAPVSSAGTATLFLQGPKKQNTTLVFKPPGAASGALQTPPLSEAGFIDAASECISSRFALEELACF